MNAYLKWFERLTWIGVAVNLGFILPALFAPDLMEAMLGPGSMEFALVWVAYAGFLLLLASLFYLPAARDPLGFHVYAWLSVVGRGIAACFWLWQNGRWELPGPIQTFWITDGAFCVLFLVLLQLGLPAEQKISIGNLGRVMKSWGENFSRVFDAQTPGALRAFALLTWLAVLVNLGCAALALLAPESFVGTFGGTQLAWVYLWVGNCGMLLVQISLFALPASVQPERYRVYAWLSVAGWFGSAAFWLWQTSRWSLSGATGWFWLIDAVLAILLLLALQRGLPATYRASGAGIGGVLRSWGGHVAALLKSPVALGLLVLVLLVGGYLAHGVYDTLLRTEPDPIYDDPAEQFKYGAIGLAVEARIPYYLWQVLPEICPDKLPDADAGWKSLGLLYEDGKDLPIGFALRHQGYPAVEPNCSLCHTAAYRTEADSEQQIALGGPAHTLDLQAFQWFLYDCAQDPRFKARDIVAKIRDKQDLSWLQAKLYEYVVIPTAKSGLETQRRGYSWQKSRPPQGRGRTDTFNPTKITVFNLPDDGSIGTVDLPAIWNQRAREGMYLHWDGNNNAIRERNYAAAMAVGATPDSVLPDHFKIVTDFVLQLPPPAFPGTIDEEKSARGWEIFKAQCASCHEFGGPKIGTVTNIADVGTDPHRLESFTEKLVETFHTVHEGLFQFDAYRKTQGYANLPIDGIWARGPYLHNGSVPTLWDLLQPVEQRPKSFRTGYDVFDPVKVGFLHQEPKIQGSTFLLDTTVDGNGNGGHLYGVELTDEEKWDLIEYLKTL
ncbi:MAG: cytochrome c [Acidobacteriota bacterium]|nr:cytochrome c [Acidobacteriota bacterium]